MKPVQPADVEAARHAVAAWVPAAVVAALQVLVAPLVLVATEIPLAAALGVLLVVEAERGAAPGVLHEVGEAAQVRVALWVLVAAELPLAAALGVLLVVEDSAQVGPLIGQERYCFRIALPKYSEVPALHSSLRSDSPTVCSLRRVWPERSIVQTPLDVVLPRLEACLDLPPRKAGDRSRLAAGAASERKWPADATGAEPGPVVESDARPHRPARRCSSRSSRWCC